MTDIPHVPPMIPYWDHDCIKSVSYAEYGTASIKEFPKYDEFLSHIQVNYLYPIFSPIHDHSVLNKVHTIEKMSHLEFIRRVFGNLHNDPVLSLDPGFAMVMVHEMHLEILKDLTESKTASFMTNMTIDHLLSESYDKDKVIDLLSNHEVSLCNLVKIMLGQFVLTPKPDDPESQRLFKLSNVDLLTGMIRLLVLVYSNVKLDLLKDRVPLDKIKQNIWIQDSVMGMKLLITDPLEMMMNMKKGKSLINQLDLNGIVLEQENESEPNDLVKLMSDLEKNIKTLIPDYQEIVEYAENKEKSKKLKDDDFE